MRRRSARHYLRWGRGQMTRDSLVHYRSPRLRSVRTKRHFVMRVTPPRYFRRAWMQWPVPCARCGSRKCWLMTGDRDGAFDKLGKLVKLPFGLNHGDLKLNPMWDDLRDDPRFDRILAESALPIATNG